jgi:hypothetical protein
MSKFLLNLLLQIPKALVNLKIQFLIQKFFSLLSARSASGLASPLAAPFPIGRNSPGRPIQPARRSRLRGKYVFLFGSRLPEPAASPSSLCQPDPTCQIHPFPTPTDPGRNFSVPPLPRAAAPRLGCP